MSTSKNYSNADRDREQGASHTRRPDAAATGTGSRGHQAAGAEVTEVPAGVEFERRRRDQPNPLAPATIEAYRKKLQLG